MEAGIEDLFDWSEHSRVHLCEASLRLLVALGSEARFPEDPADIEALIGRVAEGRPGEVMDFAVESATELPRYSGESLTWISPVADGCLRLRHEYGELESEAVVLRPDGRLGEFERIVSFGVPDDELTERARADREAVERLAREREGDEVDSHREIDEEQRRFAPAHLLAVHAAPPQAAAGPVVTFVVLYDAGLIVYYLVPRPPDDELETDDPWAEPLLAAMTPRIELSDRLGTSYEMVDLSYLEADAPLLRASQSFVPAVPKAAALLAVRFESAGVEIDLGPR